MALPCSSSISHSLNPCRISGKTTHHHQWCAQHKLIRFKPIIYSHIRYGSSPPLFLRSFGSLISSKLSSSMTILAMSFSHLTSLWHQYSFRDKTKDHFSGNEAMLQNSNDFDELCNEMNGGKGTRRQISSYFSEQGGLAMALLSTKAIAKDQISPVIASLCANPTFMSGLMAWAIAQVLKVFTTFFVEKRWDWKMALGSGGMPSSHSALCVALTTSVAICHGIGDALFPVCLGFSLIVMYDATGVRRHAGMQAEVLNMIVEDLFQGHPISEKKLKELLGHTPLQVAAGAILGIIAGYLCSQGSAPFPGQV